MQLVLERLHILQPAEHPCPVGCMPTAFAGKFAKYIGWLTRASELAVKTLRVHIIYIVYIILYPLCYIYIYIYIYIV